MDRKLPFVWRNTVTYHGENQRNNLLALSTEFMLVSSMADERFRRYERGSSPGNPCSILIVMDGEGFYRKGQSCRSDIRWMWKLFRGNNKRVEVGKSGYLTILWTQEHRYYKPSTIVTRGTWAEAELMWSWIELVCNHSWYKQKKGQIRKLLDGRQTFSDMLVTVSTELIERGDDG